MPGTRQTKAGTTKKTTTDRRKTSGAAATKSVSTNANTTKGAVKTAGRRKSAEVASGMDVKANSGTSEAKKSNGTTKKAAGSTTRASASKRASGASAETAGGANAAVLRTKPKYGVSSSAQRPTDTILEVSPDQRYKMIAEAAYLRAAAHGFSGGDPEADWLEAEVEIDTMLETKATPIRAEA